MDSAIIGDNCALIPEGYDEFIRVLKERIRTVQMKAALAVNREPASALLRNDPPILAKNDPGGI
jgi:hypothetical protein